MKFERKYVVGVRDIGKDNKITNFAILSFLEEIASLHSATVGYGVNDIETKKKVWILMDWKLKVIERPKYGDELVINTWARPISKHVFYTYRDFEVYCNNKKVAIATSRWVLVDLNIGRISKINDDIISLYKPDESHVFEEPELEKVVTPIENILTLNYEVKRSDIDINKHMHNLNYLSLAYEALPEEIYLQEEKNNIRIMYKHQILLKDKVNCYYSRKDDKDIITIKNQDNTVLHAIIELI